MSRDNIEPIRGNGDRSAVRLTLVTSEIKRRARRLNYLRAELLSEPAWDILLHAYSLQLNRRRVTASELVDRINAPSTTVVRWMKVLELDGLLTRTIVASDSTQVTVELTRKGLTALEGYFSESP